MSREGIEFFEADCLTEGHCWHDPGEGGTVFCCKCLSDPEDL